MILQLLNVLIGLTLVYLIFSTIASALFEIVEGWIRERGKLLARGLEQLFARTASTSGTVKGTPEGAVREFYQHALINSLFEGDYQREGRKLPSYIPPERFAQTVLMLAEDAGGDADNRFVQLRELALRLAKATATADKPSPTPVEALVGYFNQSMDRVSGWFGRYARGVLLVIGLALAVGGNVDTLRIVRVLAMDPVLADRIAETAGDLVAERSDVVGAADHCAEGAQAPKQDHEPEPEPEQESSGTPAAGDTRQVPGNGETEPATSAAAPADAVDQQLCQLKKQRLLAESLGLPIGWNQGDFDSSLGKGICDAAFWRKLFGLALTGLALSFGATFWFDLLSRLVNLRASLKPGDKDKDKDGGQDGNKGKVVTPPQPQPQPQPQRDEDPAAP